MMPQAQTPGNSLRNEPCAAQSESQFQCQQRCIEQNIQELELLTTELENRLNDVCQPMQITTAAIGSGIGTQAPPPEVALVPVAERMRNSARSIVTINERLRSLRGRIEL